MAFLHADQRFVTQKKFVRNCIIRQNVAPIVDATQDSTSARKVICTEMWVQNKPGFWFTCTWSLYKQNNVLVNEHKSLPNSPPLPEWTQWLLCAIYLPRALEGVDFFQRMSLGGFESNTAPRLTPDQHNFIEINEVHKLVTTNKVLDWNVACEGCNAA